MKRAEPLLPRTLGLRRQHLEPKHPNLIESLIHLGELRAASGKADQAIELYREALEILLHLEEAPEEKIGSVRQLWARATLESGDLKAAESLQRDVLKAYRDNPSAAPLKLAQAMNELGSTLQFLGQLDEAEALHRQALNIEEALLPNDHLALAKTREYLGLVLIGTGQYGGGEALFRESLSAREKALDPEHPRLAEGLTHLAIRLYFQGHLKEAEEL